MATDRSEAGRHLRMVRDHTNEPTILDLSEGIQVYMRLLKQHQELEATIDELRGRILRAMESSGQHEVEVDGIRAVRRIRHFARQLDQEKAVGILERVGRLDDAQAMALDPEKAREIIDELYTKGKLDRTELPYTEPRVVEALIVHPVIGPLA